jgi:hypothetical protein
MYFFFFLNKKKKKKLIPSSPHLNILSVNTTAFNKVIILK